MISNTPINTIALYCIFTIIGTAFTWNIINPDIIAYFIIVIIGLCKLLTQQQLFAGFSNDAVVSLIAIMIISKGIENTAFNSKIAKTLLKISNNSPKKTLLLLMLLAALLSGIIRSVGAISLLLPTAITLANSLRIEKRYFLLPLAFSSILGGNLTMLGASSLIILNGMLQNTPMVHAKKTLHYQPISLFSISPIGITLLIIGMGYLLLRSHLHHQSTENTDPQKKHKQNTFFNLYKKGDAVYELLVNSTSTLQDFTVHQIELLLPPTLTLVAVYQDDNLHLPPARNLKINNHAVLAFLGVETDIIAFSKTTNLTLRKLTTFKNLLNTQQANVFEIVIPPASQLIGQKFSMLNMRRHYNIQVLAILRNNITYSGNDLIALELRKGDTLAVYGKIANLRKLAKNPDFFILTNIYTYTKHSHYKTIMALMCLLFALLLTIFAKLEPTLGLVIAALSMIICGVLRSENAYSISWKTVFLIAGLLPLSLLIQTSGLAEYITNMITPYIIAWPIWGIHVTLAIITTIFSSLFSHTVAVTLLIPIALDLATLYPIDPRAFALTVAMMVNNTFVLTNTPANILICSLGNYTKMDFLKMGWFLTILYIIVVFIGQLLLPPIY